MKIKPAHRKKAINFLKEFYSRYPNERWTIFHFVKYFKLRQKNKRDVWMGVSGETGTGKSLFVILSMILHGRPLDLKDRKSVV